MKHRTLHGWPCDVDVDSTPTPRETPHAMRQVGDVEELAALARQLSPRARAALLALARELVGV